MTMLDELDEGAPVDQLSGHLDLSARLNASQLAAATYGSGPLLIVAGAGSGKTRALVHRVAYLVDKGIPPQAILLLTFTRKAAREMLGRATALVGRKAAQVAGGTFHGLANQLIRPYANLFGYPAGFAIMDQDDAETLIARIRNSIPEIKRHKRFPQKGAILGMLSQSINKDRPLLETISESFPHFLEFAPIIDKVGWEYREHKIKNALMDFDDLLVGLEIILRDHEDVRQRVASRYQYILVDEYQDTNPIQARLTHLLGRDHLNVTAVGDEAQSIYAFRGASFRNIMDFPKIFPNTHILKLQENYRSQEPIISLANHLIAEAREKYDKKLLAMRKGGDDPRLVAVEDQADEAGWVAARIEQYLDEGLELKDMAVLFRASSHSFDLEVELVRRRLPFTKYGGRKFLESAHIKDFLAFLRVAANPADSISLRRTLRLVDGIGDKGAEEIIQWVGADRDKLLNLALAPAKGKAKKNLEPLAELLKEAALEDIELSRRIKAVAAFYYPMVRDLFTDDWPDRQTDIKEIMRMAEDRADLRSFLDDLTLDPPNQKRGETDGRDNDLTLSTIHSAKGLEWKVVFILSAVEGRFPPVYAARSAAEIEEERRLMYVAVTRAEDMLYIMLPLGCIDRRAGLAVRPSRFLPAVINGRQAKVWHKDVELDINELLNTGSDLGYTYKVPFSSPAIPREAAEPYARAQNALASRPEPLSATQIVVGFRVCHPTYGVGTVAEIQGPAAVIEFDYFGRKRVVMQYARLSAV